MLVALTVGYRAPCGERPCGSVCSALKAHVWHERRSLNFSDLVPSGCTMAQAKILIVDDEVVVAEDIRRQLRALGYLVVGVGGIRG
jgi:hypothetical protein